MPQLFHTKQQLRFLVDRYCKKYVTQSIDLYDIANIIYQFYFINYKILDKLLSNKKYSYYGSERDLSRLLTNTIMHNYVSNELQPILTKYRSKCALLYGSNEDDGLKWFVYRFVKEICDIPMRIIDLYLLQSDISGWKGYNMDQPRNGILIIEHCELFQQYKPIKEELNTLDDSIWGLNSIASKNAIFQQLLQLIKELDQHMLVIGVAFGVNNLRDFPDIMFGHRLFDLQVDLTNMISKTFKQRIMEYEAPLGVEATLIEKDACHDTVIYYDEKFKEIIDFGRMITKKLKNNASVLVYGYGKRCGKTLTAIEMALNTRCKQIIRLQFDVATCFNKEYDYDSVIRYIQQIFDTIYDSNDASIIIIDDMDRLSSDIMDDNDIPNSNPILIALLALLKRQKRPNSKVLIIATSKYNKYNSLNLNEYFEFIRYISHGLIKSDIGIKVVLENNGLDKFCVLDKNMNGMVKCVKNILVHNSQMHIGTLLDQCDDIKYRLGYIDALLLWVKNLPFMVADLGKHQML